MSPRQIAKVLGSFGAIALTAIVVVAVVVVRYRAARQNSAQPEPGMPSGTLLHAHNFHWTQMKGGASQWVLKAHDASYADDRQSLTLTGAQIRMTATDGKQVDISAGSARLKMNGNHIIRANMSEGLVVHYGDFVLNTDAATFVPDSDQLDAPGPVKIQGPDVLITGIGLTGHPKAQIFELKQQVATQVTPRQASTHANTS
jgi:LPS export ABC transporter protein LptC